MTILKEMASQEDHGAINLGSLRSYEKFGFLEPNY
jgi:hypothetical protein